MNQLYRRSPAKRMLQFIRLLVLIRMADSYYDWVYLTQLKKVIRKGSGIPS